MDVKTREVLFHVEHYQPNPEHERLTYVEATAFSTRGEDGKYRKTRYRFCRRAGVLLGETDDVPEHPHGACGPCTLRFRAYNGLGLDVADVALQPGAVPTLLDVAMPPQAPETVEALDAAAAEIARRASVDSKTIGRRRRGARWRSGDILAPQTPSLHWR